MTATTPVPGPARRRPVRGVVHGLAAAVLALGVLGGAPALTPTAGASVEAVPPAHFVLGACDANDNLGEIANNFISRCRKASIRQVFPGEHYDDSLGDIKSCRDASCKTAWKLLNDNRFKK